MRAPKTLEAKQKELYERNLGKLKELTTDAITVMQLRLKDKRFPMLQLAAAKDILDRAGYLPKQIHEHMGKDGQAIKTHMTVEFVEAVLDADGRPRLRSTK
jgi:hypothetical protein